MVDTAALGRAMAAAGAAIAWLAPAGSHTLVEEVLGDRPPPKRPPSYSVLAVGVTCCGAGLVGNHHQRARAAFCVETVVELSTCVGSTSLLAGSEASSV